MGAHVIDSAVYGHLWSTPEAVELFDDSGRFQSWLEILAALAKAQADARTMASSISIYTAHMGTLPAAVTDLTAAAVNGLGQSAGPFIANVPAPPPGGTPAWGAYTYTSTTAGTFSIVGTGDGTTITVP